MKKLLVNFDIQRVHIDGVSLYYEIYYKYDNIYRKETDKRFNSKPEARQYIEDNLLDD